jgi:hypothetical protein
MTTALEAVNRHPELARMSPTARALLALAWADGKPLRVISNIDDAVTLVRAEHLVRSAHLGLRDALEQAHANADDSSMRGIVRFAAALADATDELDTLLTEHDCPDVRSLTREQAIRFALELFAREEAPRGITWEQLVAAFPNDDVVPVVLDVTAAADGELVGRCNECSSAVYAGSATIAIGWPVSKPAWKTFTPSLARTAKHAAALTRAPAKNSKLHALLAGDLQTLCYRCAMNWKYGGIEMRPPAVPIEEGSLRPASETTATRPRHPECRTRLKTAAGSDVRPELVGGLVDREKAIATAVEAMDVDHRRLAAVMSALNFGNDDAEVRYRILTIAWQLDRPLRIKTAIEDAGRLEELVDLALRGGSVQRALERM